MSKKAETAKPTSLDVMDDRVRFNVHGCTEEDLKRFVQTTENEIKTLDKGKQGEFKTLDIQIEPNVIIRLYTAT